jgi:hypothetical protein
MRQARKFYLLCLCAGCRRMPSLSQSWTATAVQGSARQRVLSHSMILADSQITFAEPKL